MHVQSAKRRFATACTYAGSTRGGHSCSTGGDSYHFSTDIVQPYTVTVHYIIKAIPDEVIQYNPNITAGLSALNGAGQQTTCIDLSTTADWIKCNEMIFHIML